MEKWREKNWEFVVSNKRYLYIAETNKHLSISLLTRATWKSSIEINKPSPVDMWARARAQWLRWMRARSHR